MEDQEMMNELGRQLRCPSGDRAVAIADNMYASNSLMIFNAIDRLPLAESSSILEIGFGNGQHLSYLFRKASDLWYEGVDISVAMVAAASTAHASRDRASFQLVSGNGILPFPDSRFDGALSVNTLYFWDDTALQLREIYRTLKPRGTLVLAFIDKDFGEHLPFTQSGFRFYDTSVLEHELNKAGFENISTEPCLDDAISKDGLKVQRPYYITIAQKP